jgi:hypothetical protein
MGEIPASLSGEGPAEFPSATLESWPKHTREKKAAAPRSWGVPHVGHRVTYTSAPSKAESVVINSGQ